MRAWTEHLVHWHDALPLDRRARHQCVVLSHWPSSRRAETAIVAQTASQLQTGTGAFGLSVFLLTRSRHLFWRCRKFEQPYDPLYIGDDGPRSYVGAMSSKLTLQCFQPRGRVLPRFIRSADQCQVFYRITGGLFSAYRDRDDR